MADRWGQDPTQELWVRWRRPVLVVGGVLLALGQWDRITSGHPFLVVTGVGVACFWVSLLWRPVGPPRERRTDAVAWREHGRRSILFHSFWLVAAAVWLGAGAALYEVQPANFVVLAVPAALLGMSVLQVRGAERTAALHVRQHAG